MLIKFIIFKILKELNIIITYKVIFINISKLKIYFEFRKNFLEILIYLIFFLFYYYMFINK